MQRSSFYLVVLNNLRRMFVEKNRSRYYSIHEFAALLHERPDTMGKYLNGEQQPSLKKLKQWASILGVPVETFFEEHPKAEWPLLNKKYRTYKEDEPSEVLLANVAEDEEKYSPKAEPSCDELETDIYCLGIVLRQILTAEQMEHETIRRFFEKYDL